MHCRAGFNRREMNKDLQALRATKAEEADAPTIPLAEARRKLRL